MKISPDGRDSYPGIEKRHSANQADIFLPTFVGIPNRSEGSYKQEEIKFDFKAYQNKITNYKLHEKNY